MTALVIGVDPGLTTGIAALSCVEADGPVAPYALQVHGHQLVVPIVEAVLNHFALARPLLALEQFVVSTRAARSSTAAAGRITRELIGALQGLGLDHDRGTALQIVTRPAVTVKRWATDTRLEAAGLAAPTKGMPHARDAARHALYAAVYGEILRDPLSKREAAR